MMLRVGVDGSRIAALGLVMAVPLQVGGGGELTEDRHR